MPEFQLDTSGQVWRVTEVCPMIGKAEWRADGTKLAWADLDSFTQGYVKAMFFCETSGEVPHPEGYAEDGIPVGAGFADLAPEALARTMRDCAAFQAGEAWQRVLRDFDCPTGLPSLDPEYNGETDERAGRDLWYTRTGHGCGYWDGDWTEPHATALTNAAKAFGGVDAYLGDDGKVYLS